MPRLRRITALLLLVLWLPATLHCALEQVGVVAEAAACVDDCATDNCAAVEGGLFKSAGLFAQAPAPTLVLCLCCADAITPVLVDVPRVSPELSTSPPELPRTWQFLARAAPLPGAPSFSFA